MPFATHRLVAALKRSGASRTTPVVRGLSTAGGLESPQQLRLPPLGLRMAHASIAHPAKEQGQDAYFMWPGNAVCALGVSDGVGEWAKDGVDAAAFSHALMKGAQTEAVQADEACPATLLQKGMDVVNAEAIEGSATACVLALDRDQGVLHSISLGDSGYMIVRDGNVMFQSSFQHYFFGCPFQLQVGGKTTPKDGRVLRHITVPGDVLILGTDGLFDNLFDHEIASCVSDTTSGVAKLADDLIDLAFVSSQYTKTRKTPWAEAASEEFLMHCTGGKEDDITVVVAEVVEC